jgi:Protein of unknown function (DUF4199)
MENANFDYEPKDFKSSYVARPYLMLAMRYGLILGAASAVLQLGAWLMDVDPQNPATGFLPKLTLGLAGMLLTIFLTRVCMTEHRDEVQNGFLTLGQATGIGTLMGLGSGIVGAIYLFLFTTVINPEFANDMKANMYQTWSEQGMGESDMDKAWSMVKYTVDPMIGALLQLLAGPLGGCIFGLIIGLFLRREPEYKKR